ncbi:hypothetical protein [Streptomyces angustmyceticus]|uniref:hypothetical protein n=1 Tax=Streptomyces angustmyceticus TaxID=285578 RepID=UPI0021AF1993|nr:hypothetical protein [Streptomyces angustmyceticus]
MSMLLAFSCALGQAIFLIAYHPVRRRFLDGDPTGFVRHDVRVFGVDLDGFAVRDLNRPGGWVPQLVFVVVCAVLVYSVLRAGPGVRPRLGTVVALSGGMLLAAGLAELTGPVLDPGRLGSALSADEWLIRARLDEAAAVPEQFALWSVWVPVLTWTQAWLLRSWAPVEELLGTADGTGSRTEPLLTTVRERRDVVLTGLIPVVLLALAGGRVLRHSNVRQLESFSLTFDPELWLPYHPPALVEAWSGVLYPALRLRPLSTENTAPWLATLAICLVFLAVLAAALYAVVARATGGHPLRFVMNCWYATVLSATTGALAERALLSSVAPRLEPPDGQLFGVILGDAVRFGAAWGWATGAACLGAALLMRRRRRRTRPSANKEQLSHAE